MVLEIILSMHSKHVGHAQNVQHHHVRFPYIKLAVAEYRGNRTAGETSGKEVSSS